MMKSRKRLWAGLIALALLSPLGILLPVWFGSHGAWGEWGTAELQGLVGYLPEGLKRSAGLWKAPIPGYTFGSSAVVRIISYIASGLIGIVAIVIVVYVISKVIAKNGK